MNDKTVVSPPRQGPLDSVLARRWGVWVTLLPLLGLYAWIVHARSADALAKDQITYALYAANLMQGKYAPDGVAFLWAGPGYPLFLSAFLSSFPRLGLDVAPTTPLLLAKLCNAGFLYLSVMFVYGATRHYARRTAAFGVAVAFGCYWPAWEMLPYMMTEPLTILLFSTSTYLGVRAWRAERFGPLYGIALAIVLAYLALTKVIVGYALMAGSLLWLVVALVRRDRRCAGALAVLGLALALCTPWLAYTQRLTGKPLYWGTAGGLQLYWMSSPHAGERGDWINFTHPPSIDPSINREFAARHRDDIRAALGDIELFTLERYDRFIDRLGPVQDEVFTRIALDNIAAHPGKYAANWLANVSRMLFDAPYSYVPVSADVLWTLLPNALLLAPLAGALWVAIRRRQPLPFETLFLGTWVLIYIGGSSLVSAYPRHFYVAAPALLITAISVLASRGRLRE